VITAKIEDMLSVKMLAGEIEAGNNVQVCQHGDDIGVTVKTVNAKLNN
jgi:hypothetical protein